MKCCKIQYNGSKQIRRINDSILHLLTRWLWVNPVGVFMTKKSIFHRLTECEINGILYIANFCYINEVPLNDWAYFKWDGYDLPIFGKIEMFMNLPKFKFKEEDYGWELLCEPKIPILDQLEIIPLKIFTLFN